MELPLTGVQRKTEWLPGYHLVHLVSGTICFVGALIIHVLCMQLSLKTLGLRGRSASQDYSIVSRLYALYTPRAWILHDLVFLYI